MREDIEKIVSTHLPDDNEPDFDDDLRKSDLEEVPPFSETDKKIIGWIIAFLLLGVMVYEFQIPSKMDNLMFQIVHVIDTAEAVLCERIDLPDFQCEQLRRGRPFH